LRCGLLLVLLRWRSGMGCKERRFVVVFRPTRLCKKRVARMQRTTSADTRLR
jgi:hypothetical protein